MKLNFSLIAFACLLFSEIHTQTILEADGPGNTYELITSVLAPNYNPIEVPDCNHSSFGRHIDEVFDTELSKYVFRFHMHVTPDDDRCINFDRQRNEIKTYDQSPDHLLGVLGESVEYKWKFKMDNSIKPTNKFTHVHQLKAVGGSESSMPLITLTLREGNPRKLELNYAESTIQNKVHEVPLADVTGNWMEVTERIFYGDNLEGRYEISIVNLVSGDVVFYYFNDSIRTWRTNCDFIRPKWGIYRSLLGSGGLNDEEVLFADFSIEELEEVCDDELDNDFDGLIDCDDPDCSNSAVCSEDPFACEAYNFDTAPSGLHVNQTNQTTQLRWDHYSDASNGCIIQGGTIENLDVSESFTQNPGNVLVQGTQVNGVPNGYDNSANLSANASFTLFNANTFPAGGTGGLVPGAFYKWRVRCGCIIDTSLPLPDRLSNSNTHLSPWSPYSLFTNN